jgi:hypothetical protein
MSHSRPFFTYFLPFFALLIISNIPLSNNPNIQFTHLLPINGRSLAFQTPTFSQTVGRLARPYQLFCTLDALFIPSFASKLGNTH